MELWSIYHPPIHLQNPYLKWLMHRALVSGQVHTHDSSHRPRKEELLYGKRKYVQDTGATAFSFLKVLWKLELIWLASLRFQWECGVRFKICLESNLDTNTESLLFLDSSEESRRWETLNSSSVALWGPTAVISLSYRGLKGSHLNLGSLSSWAPYSYSEANLTWSNC